VIFFGNYFDKFSKNFLEKCAMAHVNLVFSRLESFFRSGIRIYTPYYASTEGFFGYNHCPEKESDTVKFLLAAKSVFFEFLPLENTGDLDLVTRFADEVKS
jgi:GH3 auxin-responsive promoter